MFGHDDHHKQEDKQPTPDVHVSEDLLQPEDLEHRHDDAETHAGPVEITPGSDDNSATPAADDSATTPPPVVSASNDPLLSIKNEALQSLSPLISHLNQTPEEKFRTTMMLIQATDNKDLIAEAYTAAKAIADEKIRAQALLDVVNEINYFTQHEAK